MVNAQIIVPFAGQDIDRIRALSWLAVRIRRTLTIQLPRPEHGDEWRKGVLLAEGLARCTDNIVVQHDADVYCHELDAAIEAVRDGAAWAIPHRQVLRLSREATDQLIAGEEWQGLDQPAYEGVMGGGIVVARRDVLLEAPVDPRFTGWGQEDESHGMALWSLFGEPWRGDAPLLHLWHPPQPRLTRRYGSEANWQLRERYAHALYSGPDAMRVVLSEARRILQECSPIC